VTAWGLCRTIAVLALFLGAGPVLAADEPPQPSFADWVKTLRVDALKEGIKGETFDAAFKGVEPIAEVVELDRKQPEFTQTFPDYLTARLTQARVARGQEMLAAHEKELDAVADKYHVEPSVIAAIWGMETNYGSFMGSYSVVASLATLAYDTRRSTYFRKELINALKILDAGNTTPDAMKGSWAGAMGQSQFMPSSFLAYAQDFNGDGRRDIWGTPVDVFASIANYLGVHGWSGAGWGVAVRLPEGFDRNRADIAQKEVPSSCRRALDEHSVALPLAKWRAMGLKAADGADLPDRPDIKASLVIMEDGKGPAYLTYPNYRAILSYNCSNFYALAVGLLSDALRQPLVEAVAQ
jgi:membrane-bound lytic murein transglycosylase B